MSPAPSWQARATRIGYAEPMQQLCGSVWALVASSSSVARVFTAELRIKTKLSDEFAAEPPHPVRAN